MAQLSRREFLKFIGATSGTAIVPSIVARYAFGSTPIGPSFLAGTVPTPVRLPHDLGIYDTSASYLPSSGTTGAVGANPGSLAAYTAYDDVVVSPEFERYVLIRWGDRPFPNENDYFGYNSDYTAFTKLSEDLSDGLLWVNHEYVSFPMSRGAPESPASLVTVSPVVATSFQDVIGFPIDVNNQLLRWGEYLYNMGGSIVRVQRQTSGRYKWVADNRNRRYHLLSGLAINAGRSDVRPDGTAYNTITSWGPQSHQQGDNNYLIGTGPVADQVFKVVNADGLAEKIIGTGFNCSGAYTPWGTVLSAEENFQGSAGSNAAPGFFVGVQENVGPNGSQTSYGVGTPNPYVDPVAGGSFLNYTSGTFFGQLGEKYGYMVEIDPADPEFRGRKHTALGRFRHENAAFFAEPGKPLVAYMGDDRRGGNTWRYVSKGRYPDRANYPTDAAFRDACSKLLEVGTLYAALFNPDGTGRWLPLTPTMQVNPIAPSVLASQEAVDRGVPVSSLSGVILRLPSRPGVAGASANGGPFNVTPATEGSAIPSYRSKGGTITDRIAQLKDYYNTQGAILADAYLAANLIGATPGARPEDIEVNPNNTREVFIAYTDGAPGSDGYPDSRIFVTGKYTTAINDTQQSGGLYKIIEDSASNNGPTFKWERFLQGGEDGAEYGAGFANIDNLSFDQDGNIWVVTDMTTSAHNGFNTTYTGATLQPGQTGIDHSSNSNSGANATVNLVGTFGNNWLFYTPVSGPDAGLIRPVGYGPPRCEMTGPSFVGGTLFISVQHPGEDSPINGDPNAGGAPASQLSRSIQMLSLSGASTYSQTRTLPRGSNWPSNISATDGGGPVQIQPTPGGPFEDRFPPRPSVIAIRKKPAGTPT